MKITLLVVGQTDFDYLKRGIDEYVKRINRYVNFNIEVIPDIKKTKSTKVEFQKNREGQLILSRMKAGSEMFLFDEKGKTLSSRDFASFLEKRMISGIKELILVVGGAYGFSEEVKNKSLSKISLSKMTFSHQMVRLLCVEQIYRAFTILNGEPYHHD